MSTNVAERFTGRFCKDQKETRDISDTDTQQQACNPKTLKHLRIIQSNRRRVVMSL